PDRFRFAMTHGAKSCTCCRSRSKYTPGVAKVRGRLFRRARKAVRSATVGQRFVLAPRLGGDRQQLLNARFAVFEPAVPTGFRSAILGRTTEERPMIIAIVTFNLAEPTTLGEITKVFKGTAPKYQGIPGLLRKNYWMSEDGRRAGGIYVWASRADADRVY